jgi:uncharacterized membrane protein YGL010W
MIFGKTWNEWVGQYEKSHQHPVNRLLHLVGIPLIILSLLFLIVIPFKPGFWPVPLIMFITGWIFQLAGHWVEGKPPEFFHDWRFLFVGLRWWIKKIGRRN